MWAWEHDKWPDFTWDKELIRPIVKEIEAEEKQLLALATQVAPDELLKSRGMAIADELMASFAIEGVRLNRQSVWSSVSEILGITKRPQVIDHYAQGLASMYTDAMENPDNITSERIFSWHMRLFPYGKNQFGDDISVGEWRKTPIKVIAGSPDRGDLHKNFVRYVGVPPEYLDKEMGLFLNWLKDKDDIESAALAHLWFVMIHPLQDGNGRTARTISDAILARHDKYPFRTYSISLAIHKNARAYYKALEGCSNINPEAENLDVTRWMEYFCSTLKKCVVSSRQAIEQTLIKTAFWDEYRGKLSSRESKVVNKILNPAKPFVGKITLKKYAALANSSIETAMSDIQHLVDLGVFQKKDDELMLATPELNVPDEDDDGPSP